MKLFIRIGLCFGIILVLYGVYLTTTVGKLLELDSKYNIIRPINPYLFCFLIIFVGALFIVGYWLVRKKFQ